MSELELDLRSYRDATATHAHSFHQFILPLRGRLDLEIEGRCGHADVSQGVLVPAEKVHAYTGVGSNRFVILNFPLTAAAMADRLGDAGRYFFAMPRAIDHLLHFIAARPDRLAGYAEQMAPLLLATLGEEILSGEGMPRKVTQAMAFIRGAYRRPIEVRDVAQATGLSAGRLHRLFRIWAGTTPGRYLSDVRLERARDLLANSDRPVAVIALAVGFSEQSAFTRAFRRRFDETPLGYRQRLLLARTMRTAVPA